MADATFTPGYKFSMGCWKRLGCKQRKCKDCDKNFSGFEAKDEPKD
jgi:hypothetical protein